MQMNMDALTKTTIADAVPETWASVDELSKATKYAASTLRTFLPRLVRDGALVAKPTRRGRGRPTLSYKKAPKNPVWVFAVTMPLAGGMLERVFAVDQKTSLADFADILNAGIGWRNEHLHEFEQGKKWVPVGDAVGVAYYSPERMGDIVSESEPISALFKQVGDEATYHYDFGDDWIHRIEFTDVIERTGSEPALLSATGVCPEEDSGGTKVAEWLEPDPQKTRPLSEGEVEALRERIYHRAYAFSLMVPSALLV